ncbi:MAG: trigger factor [Candidatus Paceibacterota bacterium]
MATETAKLYENVKITELENSEIEIEGEIPLSCIPAYRTKALKKLGEHANIDGFRKGHIPEKVLIEKVGEGSLMGEVAELALADMYPTLVQDKNLEVIGAPQVTITKLAPGNPIGFKIKSAIVPAFTLPDYTTIAKEVMGAPVVDGDALEVTDADVEKVMTEVRRGKARFEKAQKQAENPNTETGEPKEEPKVSGPVRTNDSKKSTSNGVGSETPLETGTKSSEDSNGENLPELDDAFVATLGDFKTVADFEKRVRRDLEKEKEQKNRDKKRITLSEKLIEATDIKLPTILVSSELDKMVAQMKDDTARMNMKFEDYLTHVKKTEADLRLEWKEQAEKRATLQLLLNKIADKEKISADHDAVHKQMDIILEHHKDADPRNVHIYVETQLTNEAVFQLLEEEKKEKETPVEK